MEPFAGIELGDDRIPDETTILNFRHLLERHGLTEALFAEVDAHLVARSKARARDPEMLSTKKATTGSSVPKLMA